VCMWGMYMCVYVCVWGVYVCICVLIWCPNWCGWCFRLLYIECDLAVVWERFQGFDCECSQRRKMEICDGIIYSAVTKCWAVGVSAERVSSQSSIDDVQSQVLTELQQLPSVSVHLRITVLSGGVGRKQSVTAGNESGALWCYEI